jgi:hypothetical protein
MALSTGTITVYHFCDLMGARLGRLTRARSIKVISKVYQGDTRSGAGRASTNALALPDLICGPCDQPPADDEGAALVEMSAFPAGRGFSAF